MAVHELSVKYDRFYVEIWRRSRALKDLPGPKYGLLGIISSVVNKNIHRQATAWANQFGPLFRVRFLCYHVSQLGHHS
jgi:hypothetical protein